MNKIKTVTISLAVVFLMTGAVYAQTKGGHRSLRDESKWSILKELNLTSEQSTRLEFIRNAQAAESVNIRKVIKEKMAKLQEEFNNSAVTRAAIEPLANEIKALQAQLLDQRVNRIFAVKEVLTLEQFAKFQQMTEKRKEGKKGWFQQWREKYKGTFWRQQKQS
ncbi:MAG: periplasmic heavy metal sensor [Candidatus Omnitrophota bacterium]